MAHELAGALQQASRIGQRCAVKEPHVCVRSEYIHIAEGRISQACDRTAVMQKLPDFVPAFSHRLKPLMRDGSQFTGMLFHPRIDGGVSLDSAVESQQFCSHHFSTFCFRELWLRNGRFARQPATAGFSVKTYLAHYASMPSASHRPPPPPSAGLSRFLRPGRFYREASWSLVAQPLLAVLSFCCSGE